MKENAAFVYLRPRRKMGPRSWSRAVFTNLYFSFLIKTDRPKRQEERKYHISLCVMFKDEAPYLREWLEYHKMIGVDHFYLYDNNSSDRFEAVIQPYMEDGWVTLIRWPALHAQVDGYEDCIQKFQSESDWIGFIDVDEFIVPVKEESLKTFLDRFSRRPAVVIYWRFFGSGGKLTRDTSRLVTEDFVVASEKLYDKGKCFFNSNYDYCFDRTKNGSMFHYLWTVSKGKAIPPVDMFDHTTLKGYFPARGTRNVPLQLNHYAVKSLEEHRQKDRKGDVFYDHPTHNDGVFFGRDRRCEVADYHIFKYVSELKYRLAQREKEDLTLGEKEDVI